MIRHCVICESKDVVTEPCMFKGTEKDIIARQYVCNDCGAEWYGVPGRGVVIYYTGEGFQIEENYNALTWYKESGEYNVDMEDSDNDR